MRRMALGFLFVAAGLGLAAGRMSAHHGVSNYDMKKTIVLAGTVTAFDWSNPHCLIYLDAADDSSHVKHWTLELASTLAMTHRGWDKDTLKRGDQINVETHPARNDAPIGITAGPGFALKVVVNGKEVPSR
jgi:uncharacterized protein DUF6152